MASQVRQDPEYVETVLKIERSVMLQDVECLRACAKVVERNEWPNRQTVSAMDYLRSNLITFRTSSKSDPGSATPAAWHPFILEYCRTLGVESDAIDRLFQRFVYGDVSDKRAVVSDGDKAVIQYDLAIAKAHQQWLNGDPIIHADDESVRPGRSAKSFTKGDADIRLKAAFTKHHKYSTYGQLDLTPIGSNLLADNAGVSKTSASRFFKTHFGGHRQYKAACRDEANILKMLKKINE